MAVAPNSLLHILGRIREVPKPHREGVEKRRMWQFSALSLHSPTKHWIITLDSQKYVLWSLLHTHTHTHTHTHKQILKIIIKILNLSCRLCYVLQMCWKSSLMHSLRLLYFCRKYRWVLAIHLTVLDPKVSISRLCLAHNQCVLKASPRWCHCLSLQCLLLIENSSCSI